jgi:hypothetical protein
LTGAGVSLTTGNYIGVTTAIETGQTSNLVYGLMVGVNGVGNLSNTSIVGGQFSPSLDPGNNVSIAIGVEGTSQIDGVATDVMNLYAGQNSAGNITNLYGLYIEDMSPLGVATASNGIVTNGYAIYSAGGEVKLATGNVTITDLAGVGNVVACLDSNGKLYRGNSTGCP